ncbi:MFS transporter [Enterococcus xiangfangensis]|uniref:MFS transporter n=1 Tax=Enterococcus xiangfangensis TaxID=1296537 RepID=UPI0010FA17E0|nr:MFS transporter [Enterococcus xiangfangensis]MBM7712814.1 MFS family permease [Enterococcus xiangfangensis]
MIKKIGIVSLSSVTGAASIIASVIPLLAVAYPNQSLTSVESLVTISSLSALVTILLNNFIVRKIGIKPTIIAGLFLGAISGILPFFVSNYYLFLCLRIILGIGIGLYSPHAISLISLFYSGRERTKLLGIQMGISALGNAILLFIAGWLASFGWRWTFFVYSSLAVIALLILSKVPNVTIKKAESKKVRPLNKTVTLYIILCFLTFLIIWGVQLKLPAYLVENSISSSSKSGMLLSLMNIAGMCAGLSFSFFFDRIKRFLLPISYIGAAICVWGILLSANFLFISLFSILFNFIYSFTGPSIILKANSLAEEDQIIKVNSLISSTTILSMYLAPLCWNFFTGLFSREDNVSVTFSLIIASLFFIGVVIFLSYLLKKAPKKN